MDLLKLFCTYINSCNDTAINDRDFELFLTEQNNPNAPSALPLSVGQPGAGGQILNVPAVSNVPVSSQPIPNVPIPNVPVVGMNDLAMGNISGGTPLDFSPESIVDMAKGVLHIEKIPNYLGYLYQLNKLYFRLKVLNNLLMNIPDTELDSLRYILDEAFSIFKLVINNIDVYKESLNKIILFFSAFVYYVIKYVDEYCKKNRK